MTRLYDDARRSLESWFDRWWLALCGVALIIASDYKTRTREPQSAVSGRVDLEVVVELALYGLVAYAVVSRGGWGRRFFMQPHVYLACVFVGLVTVSATYATYPMYASVRAVQTCILLALTLTAAARADRAHFHRFAHLFLGLVVVSVAYGVVRPSPPAKTYLAGRFTWLAIHPTVSGVLAGLASLVALAYVVLDSIDRPGPRWPREAYAATLLVVGGATFAAHTRGAVLGAIAGAFALLARGLGRKARIDAFAALAVAALAAWLAFSAAIVAYFERGEDPEQLSTLNERTNLWTVAFHAVRAEPLYGYGVASSRALFYAETGLGGGHNAVVNVLVELGVVGLVWWIALIVAIVIAAARLPRRTSSDFVVDSALVLAVMAFLLVDGLFNEGPGSVSNVAFTWIFMCVAWIAADDRGATGQSSARQAESELTEC